MGWLDSIFGSEPDPDQVRNDAFDFLFGDPSQDPYWNAYGEGSESGLRGITSYDEDYVGYGGGDPNNSRKKGGAADTGYHSRLQDQSAIPGNRPGPQQSAFGRLGQVYGQGEKELRSGYRDAIGEVNRVGNQGRRDILERHKGMTGNVAAHESARGLYGSRSVERGERYASRETDRSLSRLSEGLAGIRSGIQQQRGQDLSSFFQMRWESEYPIYAAAYEALVGTSMMTSRGGLDYITEIGDAYASLYGAGGLTGTGNQGSGQQGGSLGSDRLTGAAGNTARYGDRTDD